MSNRVNVDDATFAALRDKVVVLTGGANGIGLATLRHLSRAGARIVFGDFDAAAGEQVAAELKNAVFVKVDVSKYDDNVRLFKTALETFARVDHAVACAGIIEKGKWFDSELTVETVEKAETTQVLDVNFLGVMYFTRIAAVYLRHGKGKGEDKSITLIASAAGFRDSPGLFMYQCSKHAVMGLLRATRKILFERDGIRVNAICPAIVDTAMTTAIIGSFKETGQAINSAEDVARYIVGLEVATELNGKAVYVEGGRGWEIMDGLDETMPVWLGEEPTRRLRKHLEHVKQGGGWKIE